MIAAQQVSAPVDVIKKRYSVTELFGPTMQGEGIMVGRRTAFLRLHFCDGDGFGNWCSWCDTKYTWDKNDPAFKNYQRLTAAEIVSKVSELYGIDPEESDKIYEPMWVTISGGNPVMQLDDDLVDLLKGAGYKLQVETQGTIWKPCLMRCDKVVVSPKAPSSGLVPLEPKQVDLWLAMRQRASFKIVVFDDTDFDWADRLYAYVRKRAPSGMPEFCLQAGTSVTGDVTEVLLKKYQWLVEKWLASGKMSQAIVLPQVHALVWGRRKGV